MELERTLKLIAALRRRQHISEAEMIQLSRQVVATALTADRGERLLDELRDVKVDGDPQKNEGLLREASQLLQMRFAREQPQ
jgi:predicted nucleic acid-binding protein